MNLCGGVETKSGRYPCHVFLTEKNLCALGNMVGTVRGQTAPCINSSVLDNITRLPPRNIFFKTKGGV